MNTDNQNLSIQLPNGLNQNGLNQNDLNQNIIEATPDDYDTDAVDNIPEANLSVDLDESIDTAGPMDIDDLNVSVDSDEGYTTDESAGIGGRKSRKNRKSRKQNTTEKIQSRYLKFCPHMPIHNGRYTKITKSRPHTLNWKGKKYRFYTCCKMCCKQMLDLAKSKPKTFENTYISKIEGKNIYLKHRNTHKLVQIAKQIPSNKKTKRTGKTKRTDKTRQNRKGKSKRTRKYRGGSNIRYGTGYGSNCNEPNFNIYNTNMTKLFPYNP